LITLSSPGVAIPLKASNTVTLSNADHLREMTFVEQG